MSEVHTRPLSCAQRSLWFFEEASGGRFQHLLPLAVRLRGLVNVPALREALAHVIERHEALRTVIEVREEELVGLVRAPSEAPLRIVDVTEVPPERREAVLRRIAALEAVRPFDLRSSPYLRAVLTRCARGDHVLLLTLHHVAGDGWSQGLLLQEVGAFYSAAVRGTEPSVPELAIQYGEYAAAQTRALATSQFAERLAECKRYLADAPTLLRLPVDRQSGAVTGCAAATIMQDVPAEIVGALNVLARAERTSAFAVLLACFAVTLGGWTGERDLLVGVPVTNRPKRALEALIGLFVNVLPIRLKLDPARTFREVLRQVRDALLNTLAAQDVPFERLIEELRPVRAPGRPALVQVAFNGQNADAAAVDFAGLDVGQLENPVSSSPFELQATAVWSGQSRLRIGFAYSTDLFERATIAALADHWRTVIERVASDADAKCSALLAASPGDRLALLSRAMSRSGAPDPEATVAALFEEQARARPDAVALVEGEHSVTYGELHRRAVDLAYRLRETGAGSERRVGLCVEPGIGAITGIVAVALAGAAYVPVSPEEPPQRRRSILTHAGVTAVITDSRHWPAGEVLDWPVVTVPGVAAGVVRRPGLVVRNEPLDPDNLLYIMYTSGSTGSPKGVAVTHRGVVRVVYRTTYVEISPTDVLLQGAPLGFDASTFEIWGALLSGARLVIMRPGATAYSDFVRLIERTRVTLLWLPSGLLHVYAGQGMASLGAVSRLLTGGDVINPAVVARVLAAPGAPTVVACYGPTECTTFSTCAPLVVPSSTFSDVPIGRPIDHTSVYVLDADGELAPPGAIGELYVGGAGLARGYWNRPDLTAAAFVPNPFDPNAGTRLYRTGDRARWRADGQLQFLGRMDDEVKIRGHRVSPAEIADACRRFPDVEDAVVIVTGEGAESKVLVAHVVPRTETTADSIRARLQSELPSYAVPGRIVLCERLPLTANGKVDRRALAERDSPAKPLLTARTALERLIADAWCTALGCEHIDVNTNVFDVGAHSLTLIEVHAALERALPRPIAISHLFQYPTVRALADFAAAMPDASAAVESGRRRGAAQNEARRQRVASLHAD